MRNLRRPRPSRRVASRAARSVLAPASRTGIRRRRVDRRARARARACAAWARCPTRSHRSCERSPGIVGDRPHALQHRRLVDDRERAAGRSRARKGGYIALAHNGNLINAGELRVELEEQGSIFASTKDSEVIVHRLARSTARRRRRSASPTRCSGVEGAYSLIVAHRRHAARRARSARLASAGDGPAGRRRRLRVRDLRARHRRRDVRARRRAGRDHRRRRRRRCARSIRCRRRSRSAASSSTSTSRVPTAASSAARSIARGARSAGGSRGSIPRRAPISCSACPIRRTPRRSGSPRRADCRTSSRSSAITTSAGRSSSRRRPAATRR